LQSPTYCGDGCGAAARRARSSLLDVTTATPASLVAARAEACRSEQQKPESAKRLPYRLRRLATVGYHDRLLVAIGSE